MSASGMEAQSARADTQIQSLLNNDLKQICKSEALLISGVKSVLQNRIRTRMRELVETGDAPGLTRLTNTIASFAPPNSQTPKTPVKESAFQTHSLPSYQHMPTQNVSNGMNQHQNHRPTLDFKKSVFYDTLQVLVRQNEMPAVGQHRNAVTTEMRFSDLMAEQLLNNPSLRVMLFCCADPGYVTSQHKQDIAFPSQVEVRVNNTPYQGNLRGLKKKPGTTSPADIKPLLKLVRGSINTLSITYAATDRKYYYTVFLVRKYEVNELVQRIATNRRITKSSVINDMLNKAKDPDIEATSSIMSLKCPISTIRMALPCRSTICVHNQCFDASSFLQAQMQAPQWSCPVCYKVFDFDSLAVDEYVQDILAQTSKSTEQVTIEPDGQWKQGNQLNGVASSKRKASEAFGDDDDDDVVITRAGPNGFNGYTTPSSFRDSPGGVRLSQTQRTGGSGTPATNQRSGSKKPPPEVIDLTLSSDDDEAPIPPIKRTKSFTGGAFGNGSPNPSPSSGVAVNPVPSRPADQRIQEQPVRHNQSVNVNSPTFTYNSPNFGRPEDSMWNPFPAHQTYSTISQPAPQNRYSFTVPRPRPPTGNGSSGHNIPPGFPSPYG